MSNISASHILVEHEHEIEDIQRKLKEGKSFEELAKQFSKCPSREEEVRLGKFGKGHDGEAIRK